MTCFVNNISANTFDDSEMQYRSGSCFAVVKFRIICLHDIISNVFEILLCMYFYVSTNKLAEKTILAKTNDTLNG